MKYNNKCIDWFQHWSACGYTPPIFKPYEQVTAGFSPSTVEEKLCLKAMIRPSPVRPTRLRTRQVVTMCLGSKKAHVITIWITGWNSVDIFLPLWTYIKSRKLTWNFIGTSKMMLSTSNHLFQGFIFTRFSFECLEVGEFHGRVSQQAKDVCPPLTTKLLSLFGIWQSKEKIYLSKRVFNFCFLVWIWEQRQARNRGPI